MTVFKKIISTLNVFKVLEDANRTSSLDISRALAILSIIVYHYYENEFPFGYLGVDLFFVISGFLVGKILYNEFIHTNTINYFRFFISRGFKIWPSYFAFLFFGNIIAYYIYRDSNPEFYIPTDDMYRFVFFVKNIIGSQYHWCFEHLWSICVEEHFYLLSPLLFISMGVILSQRFIDKSIIVLSGLSLMLIIGIITKYVLYKFYSSSINTYEFSLIRVDELTWGIILSILISKLHKGNYAIKNMWLLAVAGMLILFFVLINNKGHRIAELQNFIGFSLIPFSFTLIIAGIYFIDFSKFKLLRIIAYYSYNWYLWHTLFVKCIQRYFLNNLSGFIIYVTLTFLIAVISTVFIEEYFLRLRTRFLSKYF